MTHKKVKKCAVLIARCSLVRVGGFSFSFLDVLHGGLG